MHIFFNYHYANDKLKKYLKFIGETYVFHKNDILLIKNYNSFITYTNVFYTKKFFEFI